MSLYESQIEECLTYYRRLSNDYKRIFDNSPPGRLIHQKHNGKDQFLQMYTEGGRRIRKGITRNHDLQRSLAQKEFARKALTVLDPDVRVLENTLSQMSPFDPDELL